MAIPFPGAFRARPIQSEEVIAEAARWARAGEASARRGVGRGIQRPVVRASIDGSGRTLTARLARIAIALRGAADPASPVRGR